MTRNRTNPVPYIARDDSWNAGAQPRIDRLTAAEFDILDLLDLQAEPMTIEQIAARRGGAVDSNRRAMYRMQAAGLVFVAEVDLYESAGSHVRFEYFASPLGRVAFAAAIAAMDAGTVAA